jgi:cysteine-rich repeat protein
MQRALPALAVASALMGGCLDWGSLYECHGKACDAGMHSDAPHDAGGDALVPCMDKTCDAGPGTPEVDSGHTPGCGNGHVEGSEECDDGNTDDQDGCRNLCKWARCGDGVVRKVIEECDDANTSDDDACSNQCLACASGDKSFVWSTNEHCYTFHAAATAFTAADNACAQQRAGTLAMINISMEDELLYGQLASDKPQSFWIGLSRKGSGFAWISGVLPSFDFWDDGQPAATPNDCADEVMDPAGSDAGASNAPYVWSTTKCGNKLPYLCEEAPPTLREETNHAYFIGFHLATWQEAKDLCAGFGAHLATLDSEGEHAFARVPSTTDVWIGGEALEQAGDFHWITGEPFKYTHFAPWDGDHDTQRCVMLGNDGYWYDRDCNNRHAYLCEVD